ncbi:unnamed protein product [Colletotrichum noveboracense]|uniref:Uncharacterized protein n=1 Tax=Colletotrichum noveboracense TaxID=2664923 RepID=A0A9W4S8Y8_9PEZI|nr:unnamed protein product [Colletotrichum noveboracense]
MRFRRWARGRTRRPARTRSGLYSSRISGFLLLRLRVRCVCLMSISI